MALVSVKALSFTYPTTQKKALTDVSFEVGEGSFSLLAGATGSGKSTLLKLLKPELAPHGTRAGEILYEGGLVPAPGEIGYVHQVPDRQIVTDKVWHELAFALENAGLKRESVRLRTGEAAGYFGLTSLWERDTDALSGGEKQLLSLAGVMAASPRLLLLDEPTSRLDPVSARRFLDVLRRLKEDLGVSILLAEHRLEEVLSLADRVLVLENGALRFDGGAREAADLLSDSALSPALPAAVRLWAGLGKAGTPPLNVPEGRVFLRQKQLAPVAAPPETLPAGEPLIEAKRLTFAFGKNADPVVDGADLTLRAGEHLCLLGPNGAGKSTLLRLLAGLLPALGGKVRLLGRDLKDYKRGAQYKNGVALLPQEPGDVFLKSTVREDLLFVLSDLPKTEAEAEVQAFAKEMGIEALLDVNPLDLSGGETQVAALTKVLLTRPRVLLLDEPTKGLDPERKAALNSRIGAFCEAGGAVVTVTHDADFAAQTATRCAFLFRGQILAEGEKHAFFAANAFYLPAVSRLVPGAITVEEAVERMSN